MLGHVTFGVFSRVEKTWIGLVIGDYVVLESWILLLIQCDDVEGRGRRGEG